MRYLNVTFLPDPEWTYAFFIWLSNEDGVPFKRLNDQLHSELLSRPEWRYIYQKYGTRDQKLTFETDSGELETSGMLFPLISFYDFFINDGFKDPEDPLFRYGETFRYFGRIAKGLDMLHQNFHFYPGLVLPEVKGVLYPEARWVLNRTPLEVSGILKQWLHSIPRAALSPAPLADFHVRKWLQVLLDEWSDQILREKFADTLKNTPLRGPVNQNPLGTAWYAALQSKKGEPYDRVLSSSRKKAYRELQNLLSVPTKNQVGKNAVELYQDFQETYLPNYIHPLSFELALEPLDPHDPFGDQTEWSVDVQIKGKALIYSSHLEHYFNSDNSIVDESVSESKEETIALKHIKPDWFSIEDIERNHSSTVKWLESYRFLLKDTLALPGDWMEGQWIVPAAWVQTLLGQMRTLKRHKIDLQFPDWFKWRDASSSDVTIEADVASSSSFFSLTSIVNFKWQLSIGDLQLPKDVFNRLVKENRQFINYRGEWVSVPLEQISKVYHQLKQNGVDFKDKGKVSDLLRFTLAEERDAETSVHYNVDHLLERYLERLLSKHEERTPLPKGLVGELRPYQKKGVSWLWNLKNKGVGGCLADDMGLGKTIQTIAYLLKTKEEDDVSEPSLIVCPTSVMGNWKRELEQFAPSLTVRIHHGSDRFTKLDTTVGGLLDFDVVITSYTLSVKDAAELGDREWNSIILDEAQAIKNPTAQKSRVIKQFNARHRLALTGTPIENRLEELWSIMDFLNPGYLGSLAGFRLGFINPIEKRKEQDRSDLLKRLIQPFLLRREKTDKQVIQDLPEKREENIYCHLTETQASLYQSIVDRLMERVQTAHGMERKGLILSTLTRLKQVCNHPDLVTKENGQSEESGKLEALLHIVPGILEQRESILIFTQYVKMGQLLLEQLESRFSDIPVSFLYGGVTVKKREEMIERFQQSKSGPSIFILSLKAGGFGLNLTAANHVIHYDRWWNPAVENQATDRSYRIGQTDDVHVYKLICEGTLEMQIDDLLEKKKALSEQIIGRGDGWVTEMNDQEVYELVRLRRKVLG